MPTVDISRLSKVGTVYLRNFFLTITLKSLRNIFAKVYVNPSVLINTTDDTSNNSE